MKSAARGMEPPSVELDGIEAIVTTESPSIAPSITWMPRASSTSRSSAVTG